MRKGMCTEGSGGGEGDDRWARGTEFWVLVLLHAQSKTLNWNCWVKGRVQSNSSYC